MNPLYSAIDRDRESMDAERPPYTYATPHPKTPPASPPPRKRKSYFTRIALIFALLIGGLFLFEDNLVLKLQGYLPGNTHGNKHILKHPTATQPAKSAASTPAVPSTAPTTDLSLPDQAVRAGQFKEAFFGYLRVAQQDPTNVTALTRLVTLTLGMGDAAFQKLMLGVIEKNLPQSAPVRALTAATYATKGDFAQAAAWMEKALGIEPENLVYRQNLAVYYDTLSQWTLAAKAYQDILTALDRGASPQGLDREQISARLNHILTRLR